MASDKAETVAVIGASSDRRKFGNKGVRAFVAAGWRVIPVHPRETLIEGNPAAASILEIDEALAVVSLYVPPAVGLALLPDIATRKPGEVWINPGAGSPELLAAAGRLGLRTLETCSIIRVGYQPANFPD